MVLDDQCLSDGSYAFDTSKRISQAGEYRILAVATLANGRLVGGQAEVRVGEECQLPDGAVDLAKLKPRPDYEGHLGADYILDEGTPIVWTCPDAKIIEMRPVGGYGTMAIKLEICLAVPQVLEDETQSGSSVSTDKIHIILGHLRPTKESIANEDAQIRFNEGMLQNDISYKVGDVIGYGTLLGYVESVAYGGFSNAPHVHAGAYDAHAINELAAQNNLWRGTGVSTDSEIRGKFINIESLLQFLRA
ncbi:MAG: hypothetical protein PHU04_02945 [Candidatus Peribacteraceae bacterium]|nr:hypothetical protein [Candidatus Peribacteraceae bacterium]